MKKPILTGLLVVAMAAALTPPGNQPPLQVHAAASEEGSDIQIRLNGQPFRGDRNPLLVEGVTLVPLRNIAEALGAEVKWDETTQSVLLRKDSSEIILTLGSADAVKNGQPIRLEAAPRLSGDITMVPLRFIGESFDTLVTWNDATRTVSIDPLQALPTVGSYDNLKALLEKTQVVSGSTSDLRLFREKSSTAVMEKSETSNAISQSDSVAAAPAAPVEAKAKQSESGEYSQTNTQVEGVDEADVVKTDGTYMYQVNRGRVIITKAFPSNEMKLESMVDFDGQSFRPSELYVDDKHMIVIGTTNRNVNNLAAEPMPAPVEAPGGVMIKIAPVLPSSSVTKAVVYDITDKSAPKKQRELELDGNYVSSRKIGDAVYLITNKNARYSFIAKSPSGAATEDEAKKHAPSYRDTAVSDEWKAIDYGEIRYFPDSPEANYMLIGGFNLSRPGQAMDVSAYLGSGQNVFASENNLYAAVSKTEPIRIMPAETRHDSAAPATPGPDARIQGWVEPPAYERKTVVYKFRLEQGKTKFVTQGDVPGAVLNQFSMDEHNGIFRIATTTGDMWRTDENTSKNNLYTLDEALKPLGKIEGIAPGERIYSVRFMGNRAYMVTFKNTDPLFALDLTNPANPTVLGALKIPGFSDYLHPYDENHLIGFGKETVEVPVKGVKNPNPATMVYVQGMKLSLFDVTDVSNPVEKHKEVIGSRGTDSELLRNHKALLYSKENNLLAFPVTVYESTDSATDGFTTGSGKFSFQGAYVYRLDLQSGFDRKASITHISEEEKKKAGNGWYGSDRNVERILYIGDTLYTLSKGMIKANDLSTFVEKDSLTLP
ncbi:beta-propeller domain-containing protein [Paenibacillus sp. GCM10012303]|uniref:beta-propeller domain-containing protein n=1 Tax=Paenibacillus sp. GCM10012303 TaxID=3317340 RepID=UPI003621903D